MRNVLQLTHIDAIKDSMEESGMIVKKRHYEKVSWSFGDTEQFIRLFLNLFSF